MSEPQPMTMLDGALAADGLTCNIEERGLVGQVTLKGTLSDPALAKAVLAEAGLAVPETLRANFSDTGAVIWMAPDELLLLGAYEDAPALAARLSSQLAGQHVMALDVSDTRAVIRVEGAGAQELMAKGAPCDLSDTAFPPGTARRTHFAEIAVLILRREADLWEIACFQSFAPHLMAWLATAADREASVGWF
ncbi:MAG: sarcosine oxidase subunit gamma family protein [Pseudomonadota bacterium]